MQATAAPPLPPAGLAADGRAGAPGVGTAAGSGVAGDGSARLVHSMPAANPTLLQRLVAATFGGYDETVARTMLRAPPAARLRSGSFESDDGSDGDGGGGARWPSARRGAGSAAPAPVPLTWRAGEPAPWQARADVPPST